MICVGAATLDLDRMLVHCAYARHPRLPLNPNSKPVQILTHQTQLQLIF